MNLRAAAERIEYEIFRNDNDELPDADAIEAILREHFGGLIGADAMLRAIEQIIPRNEAHRDYTETVQLFVEEARSKGHA